jgi:hypothetical protein
MIVATLVKTFPMEAKKTSLLIGLWKAFEPRKVTAMNRQPINDRVEQTLSTVTKSFSSAVVRSSGLILTTSFEVWERSSVVLSAMLDSAA